jgi:hypothetical protein
MQRALLFSLLWLVSTVSVFHEEAAASGRAQPMRMRESPGPRWRARTLITGAARSGTTFITRVLNHSGLEFAHENGPAGDGLVSHLHAVVADRYAWGLNPAKRRIYFDPILHQVRNPVKTIASITTIQHAWPFIRRHVPDMPYERGGEPTDDATRLEASALYWVRWTRLSDQRADWTYRVEDLSSSAVLATLSEYVGATIRPDVVSRLSGEKINTRRRRSDYLDVRTWKDLRRRIPGWLFREVVDGARSYGYAGPGE